MTNKTNHIQAHIQAVNVANVIHKRQEKLNSRKETESRNLRLDYFRCTW